MPPWESRVVISQGDAHETEIYDVEILQVIENVIPELNDEFASSLGDYAGLEELREKDTRTPGYGRVGMNAPIKKCGRI